jgi:hypothetical protein
LVANNQLTIGTGADRRQVSQWLLREAGLSNSVRQS